MASEFTLSLMRTTLFMSMAVVLLMLIRTPLRRWSGAASAYRAWLAVPCVAVAAMLPAATVATIHAAPVLRPIPALAVRTTSIAPAGVDAVLLVWAAGMAATAVWFGLVHHAFLRRAGTLIPQDGVYVSAAGAGPASVGLFRPRIVVPHDFGMRYSPSEQALIVFHEQTHIARRDAVANLLACACQCVFWFNPLIHLGVRFFRLDQEIACDAIVMQHHPRQRRTYAEALLKFHTGDSFPRAGVFCQWQLQHPAKERLMSLHSTPSGTVRRIAGRCIVAVPVAGAVAGTLGARAEQVAAAPSYAVALALDAGGERSAPRVLARAGEQFAVASGAWRLEMTVRQAQTPDTVWVMGRILKGKDIVSAPTLLARLNEPATLKVGADDTALTLSLVVTPQP
jgi:beta-lactamase regulating signal transducer with metallopeptidase domain